jgi:hypothetical protein
MEEKCYFVEDAARAPGAETAPEPNVDEAMVYEDFFVAGLCMPPHLAVVDILLHFQAQLHHLTPNAIAQLSIFLGYWQLRWCAFREFIYKMLCTALSAEDC